MMWGYGFEAMWWMVLTMVIYSVVGIVVLGALLWIVVWAVSHWQNARAQRELYDEDGHPNAVGMHAGDVEGNSARVAAGTHGSLNRAPEPSDELTLSRR